MRIVFMGTPSLAATILESLIPQHEVIAVYTRPDAVRGRGKSLVPSPVKTVALEAGLPVFTPRTLRNAEEQQALAALEPDVICVAAYGAILPREVLEIPRFGCLNVHASLLPRWRGAAPIERAILAGDEQAGVCIMKMEEGLDTGDYCVCRATDIDDKTAAELTDELAILGARALLTGLVHVEEGAAEWIVQDETEVTYAEKLAKGELDLSPAHPAIRNMRQVQASSDAHPARCSIAERPVIALKTRVLADDDSALPQVAGLEPGEATFVAKRLFLGCADGPLEVLTLKPSGKKEMDAKAFAAGLPALRTPGAKWGVFDVEAAR